MYVAELTITQLLIVALASVAVAYVVAKAIDRLGSVPLGTCLTDRLRPTPQNNGNKSGNGTGPKARP